MVPKYTVDVYVCLSFFSAPLSNIFNKDFSFPDKPIVFHIYLGELNKKVEMWLSDDREPHFSPNYNNHLIVLLFHVFELFFLVSVS